MVCTTYNVDTVATRPAQYYEHLQVSLVLLFTASQCVYLFRQLQYYVDADTPYRILGFRSLDELVALMIGFNLIVLVTFLAMVAFQAFAQPAVAHFRLVTSRQFPELTLAKKMRYHLFLSHVGYGRSNLSTQHSTDKSPIGCFCFGRSGAAPRTRSP